MKKTFLLLSIFNLIFSVILILNSPFFNKVYADVSEFYESQFTDVKDITTYFYDSVHFVNDYGLMKGYQDGSFGPNDNITRAQVAVIIDRLYKKILSKESNYLQSYHMDEFYNISFVCPDQPRFCSSAIDILGDPGCEFYDYKEWVNQNCENKFITD